MTTPAPTKFLESSPGNKSNGRRNGTIMIITALIFAQEVLIFGRDNIILAATAAGTIFLTIAGPALVYLFNHKKTETQNKQQ